MAGRNKCMKVTSSRFLWVVAAVCLLTGSVSIAQDSYDVTVYQDNLTVDSTPPYGEMPDGCLIANLSAEIGGVVEVAGGYTLNLLSGSVVHYLYAQPYSIINIQGGTIDDYGIVANGGCTINVKGTYVSHTSISGEMTYDDTAKALVFDGANSWIGDLFFMFEGADDVSVIPFSTGAVINFVYADEPDPALVEIDIKPGSYPNSINIDSRGVVPVALLSNGFNVAEIDPALIRFAEARPVHWALEDVDGDGNMDMILHFRTQELVGLDENSTEAMLWTTNDSPIQIQCSDTVKILKSNRKK